MSLYKWGDIIILSAVFTNILINMRMSSVVTWRDFYMERILIIEDEELIRTELETLLKNAGFSVSSITDFDNTLSVNVMRIRDKLRGIGVGELIHTRRGMGYKI